MQNQIPIQSLPDGTGLKTTAYWNGVPFTHYGTIERAWNGQVMVHHNSKRIGRAVTTDLLGFSDGQPVSLDFVPSTIQEGWEIAKRARTDVERGVIWTVFDNCEDMKSRALTGQSGSPTRDTLLGLGALGLLAFLILKS